MHALAFLHEYLKDHKRIGSITPSSRYLARSMLRNLDLKSAETVVELGAGTGAITQHLVARKKQETCLLVFESHGCFASELEQRFAHNSLTIIRDSAENLPYYFQKYSVKRADYIISSLPLACWDDARQAQFFSLLAKHVWKGGAYVQYQYFMPTYRRALKEHFREVQLSVTFLNVPSPAWVYTCWKR